jgi:hypothetical protein
MRRSTVLSPPLLLVFPGVTISYVPKIVFSLSVFIILNNGDADSFCGGAQNLTGENLKVIWAEFSTLS